MIRLKDLGITNNDDTYRSFDVPAEFRGNKHDFSKFKTNHARPLINVRRSDFPVVDDKFNQFEHARRSNYFVDQSMCIPIMLLMMKFSKTVEDMCVMMTKAIAVTVSQFLVMS